MISYIIGSIRDIGESYFVIENNNVGFLINSSLETLANLQLNNEYKIYTSMQVREDDISLYGFYSKDELDMFLLLTKVSSIGAKTALGILSTLSINNIKNAIVNNDINELSKAKGIGKKTASRIILELVDKVKTMPIDDAISKNKPVLNDDLEVAKEALLNLGYQKNDIDKVLSEFDSSDLSLEVIIKECLKRLV